MKYILILLFSFSAGIVKGQIYTSVEKSPEFPGGQVAFLQYVSKNIQYTKADQEKEGPSRTRYVRFIIDSLGNLTTPLIENKDSSKYTAFDKRLMEMLLKMPKWIPGEQDKKKVSVSLMLPMRIPLQED